MTFYIFVLKLSWQLESMDNRNRQITPHLPDAAASLRQ